MILITRGGFLYQRLWTFEYIDGRYILTIFSVHRRTSLLEKFHVSALWNRYGTSTLETFSRQEDVLREARRKALGIAVDWD